MEDSSSLSSVVKDQSSASEKSASKLLRYPLRSAMKNSLVSDSPNSVSASKRGASSVSKSVSALHFSGKDTSTAKPPRRLSIPSKSNVRPVPKPLGSITPISEVKAKRSAISQGKTDAALADVSKSFGRNKVSDLSSASYWLSHVKLSESAAKHSLSLGFFKLALEAGCEPMQKISDELTSYVHRYNLSEPGELIKELLESYKVSETLGQSKVSETSSQVSVEGNNISDHDEVHGSSSSVTEADNLKPKSLDKGADEINQAKSANVANTKKIDSAKRIRSSVTKNVASSKAGSEVRKSTTLKKLDKPVKQEPLNKDKIKKLDKKSAKLSEGTPNSEPEETLKENKENMNSSQTEEVISAEA